MHSSGTQSQGDTQPASQWVYEEVVNQSKETQDDGLSGDEQVSQLREGDTGHVDLLGVFEQPSIFAGDGTDNANIDDDEIDPLSQDVSQDVRAEIFPESRRFQQPITPAMQSKKRKRGTPTTSQEAETPRLPTNPFAGRTGNLEMMGPSQLFATTQAITSPPQITSDPLSERPSPDIHNMQRPSTAGSVSSPLRASRSNWARAVTEPQTTYTSMKESQEAREKLENDRRLEQQALADQSSDEEMDIGKSVRRMLAKRRIDEESRNQLRAVKGLPRPEPASRGRGRGRGSRFIQSRDSPRQSGRQANKPIVISDGITTDELQGNITEDETEVDDASEEKEKDDVDELSEENKENVEVLVTSARFDSGVSPVVVSQPTPSHRPLRKSSSNAKNDLDVPATSSPNTARSPERTAEPFAASQSFAVADSQPSQRHLAGNMNATSATDGAIGPTSSLESRTFVPQSQYPQPLKPSMPSNAPSAIQTRAPTESMPPSSSSRSEESQLVEKSREESTNRDESHDEFSKDLLSVSREQAKANDAEGSLAFERAPTTPEDTARPHDMPTKIAEDPSTIAETSSADQEMHLDHEATHDPSDLMPSPRTTPESSSRAAPKAIIEPSNPSTAFETAHEHIPETPSRLRVQRMNQNSNTNTPSAKSQPIRTIGEIAGNPSPPDAFGDIDIDIDILSSEDKKFQSTVGSSPILPQAKRRRGGQGITLRSSPPVPVQSSLPAAPSLMGTPDRPPSSAISAITAVQQPSSDAIVPSSATSPSLAEEPKARVNPVPSKPARNLSKDSPPVKIKPIPKQLKRLNPVTPNLGTGRNTEPPDTASVEENAQKDVPTPEASTSRSTVMAPNRVFAHFNGNNSAYYPATCTGIIPGEEPRFQVRFDDHASDTISAYGIKRLELRIGDIVKVDMQGARSTNYLVEGFKDQYIPPDSEGPSGRGRSQSAKVNAFPDTDIHGYETVLVSPKQRPSSTANRPDEHQIAVSMARVYFTQTMWTSFKDREFTYRPNKPQPLTGLQTPSERPSSPATPSSRSRRIKSPSHNQRRTSISGPDGGQLFRNMVFTLTNIAIPAELDAAKTQILAHGGHILDAGFDELFHVPGLSRMTSPTKNRDTSFHLTRAAKEIGFTCLIADKHCRRAKYIQALALGVPCLHTRWISDCIAKQHILPCTAYLLPSGESTFLGGAVRSRVLQPFPDEASTLSTIVDNRPRMLADASILLIMQKGEEDKMKHHNFLTHALGAARVCKATSLDAAARVVADAQAIGEPWDWVYTHDKEKDAEKAIFGGSASVKKRKRGRDSDGMSLQRAKTRVVGNEFVIQSLILGQLADG